MRTSKVSALNLPGGLQTIVGPSNKRVAITFSPGDSNIYRIANDPAIINAGLGFIISTNGGPVTFTIEQHGSIVQDPWNGAPNVANIKMGFVEVFE